MVPIVWQPAEDQRIEVWLMESGQRRQKLFDLPSDPYDSYAVVELWAAQSDSVEEFLEVMHLEGLIDLDTLRRSLSAHSPLRRIWEKLRPLCGQAGDIGEYPVHRIIVGTSTEAIPETAICLYDDHALEASAAWTRFEAGEHQALSSTALGVVVSKLGTLAGRRLGLAWPEAVHLGDWLSVVITNRRGGHGDDDTLLRLEDIASRVRNGRARWIGRACINPAVWQEYPPAIAAVVRALRQRA